MHRKKIAILINSLSAGGAERVVANLLDTLCDKYEIHLLLLRDEIDYPVPKGQIIDFLSRERRGGSEAGANIIRLPLIALRLRRYCSENEIDLVLSFLNRPNLAAGLAKKLNLRSKVIMSERVFTPLFYDKATFRGRVGGFLVSALYRYAYALVPNSEGTRDALINTYGIRNRFYVATNQISVSKIENDGAGAVDDVDFSRFTFICVAGFREQKNQSLLIESFGRLNDGNTQLLFIGKGPTLESAKRKAKALGLADRVLFVGQKENPHKYVAKSHCFVLPSNFEGFPNVLLEALACRTPIISTDCLTGPRELLAPSMCSPVSPGNVLKGEYGMLVPTSDVAAMSTAMSQMAADRDVREHYSSVAAQRALDFDQDTGLNPFQYVLDCVFNGKDFD